MEILLQKLEEVLEREEGSVQPDDDFREYEEWDSLALLSVLAMINEEYDVTIPHAEFETCQTVELLYKKICEKSKN